MSGIPYMGSKRALAKKIVDYIIDNNPNAKYIYDLFGGGGAISFECLKRNQFEKVFYNELNTGVVELLKKVRTDGITPEFYKWVSREEFNANKNKNDWWGGYLKCCWSFGNNQKGYMYGSDIVEWKKALHEICFAENESEIINCFRILEKRIFKKPINYTIFFDDTKAKELIKKPKGSQRRYNLRKCILKRSESLHSLERLQSLERLERLESLQRLERLQSLQSLEILHSLQSLLSLESLESLHSLQSLESLGITNLSYENVIINTPINETIIYCDPPYINTGTYQKELDHEQFNDFVKKNTYKIYISSYESEFKEVASFEHRCKLSSTANNKVKEKLFCNKKENDIKTQLKIF